MVFSFKGFCPACNNFVEFVSVSQEDLCWECQQKVHGPKYEWTWALIGDYQKQEKETSQHAAAQYNKKHESNQKTRSRQKSRVPIRVGNRAVWATGW